MVSEMLKLILKLTFDLVKHFTNLTNLCPSGMFTVAATTESDAHR